MRITTTAFTAGGNMPTNFTREGSDQSPLIRWEELPEGTKSLALLVEDPDVPGEPFVHWLIYDIPSSVTELPPGLEREEVFENGIRQGVNSFYEIGYSGPYPPPGKRHSYVFRLFALSKNPGDLKSGITKQEFLKNVSKSILDRAELTVFYKGFRKAKKAV